MLDCGTRRRDSRFWTPSLHYFGERHDLLALLNLDEDHLADFEAVARAVDSIITNTTIGSREFQELKMAGKGQGARAYARWLASVRRTAQPLPDFGGIRIWWYLNRFIPGAQNNTNDLSLVVFVQYGMFKIMFAGDLEKAGWRRLLQDPSFRRDVIGINIFVASHHGRESGCSTELFDLFRPEIVVISDDERQFDSQDTDDWYRERCIGASLIVNPYARRYVMTTRNDGAMRIEVQSDGRWVLSPNQQVPDWPIAPEPKQSLGLGSNPLLDGIATLDTPKPSAGLGHNALLDVLAGLDKSSPLSGLGALSPPFGFAPSLLGSNPFLDATAALDTPNPFAGLGHNALLDVLAGLNKKKP